MPSAANSNMSFQLSDVAIVPMEVCHIAAVQEIEKQCFGQTWPEDGFLRELNSGTAGYLVALFQQQVIGYAGAWMIFDDMEVTSIAVEPQYRGLKIGKLLFWHLLAVGRERGCEYCTLEVRQDNQPALALYHAVGFEQVGVRKRYYEGKHDAWVMRVDGLGLEPMAQILRQQAQELFLTATAYPTLGELNNG